MTYSERNAEKIRYFTLIELLVVIAITTNNCITVN